MLHPIIQKKTAKGIAKNRVILLRWGIELLLSCLANNAFYHLDVYVYIPVQKEKKTRLSSIGY